jgi:hypothetical protein
MRLIFCAESQKYEQCDSIDKIKGVVVVVVLTHISFHFESPHYQL